MQYKSFFPQCRMIIQRKEFLLTLIINTFFILLNFWSNVSAYKGTDLVDMYYPMKLLLLSSDSSIWGYCYLLLYPILVVLPGGLSFRWDQEVRGMVLFHGRMGKGQYFFGKFASGFFVTFLLFMLPFFIEIGMYVLSFPMCAVGDLSNLNIYNSNYAQLVDNYLWKELYLASPMLYTVVFLVIFGLISGILSAFLMALSSIIRFKYKILLFLPIYLILYLPGMIGDIFDLGISTNYLNYLALFDVMSKSEVLYIIMAVVMICFAAIVIAVNRKKEWFE